VANFYVRPNQASNYGTGDGSSYANAWNGFESIVWSRLNVGGVSSTLWVCGTHKRRMNLASADYGGATYTSARRYDGLSIRGDYPGDPGVVDVRGHTYTYYDRAITAAEQADLTRFVCGTNYFNLAYSVNLAFSRNVTLSNLTLYVPGVPLGCTPANFPACRRHDLFYGPSGGMATCSAAPYNGMKIYYPMNTGIFSNSGSGNIRITGCRIIGNKQWSRIGIGLQPFSPNTSCLIDGNEISGVLKGINMDAGASRTGLSWSINRNTIRDLGFAAGEDDFVDGMDVYGRFDINGNYAEIVSNDISGFQQDGIDLFYASGVIVKSNYIHDSKLAYLKYMTTAHWNADENVGDQNGIKFGGDGGYSDKNQVKDNVVANIYGSGISNNAGGRNAMVSGNVVVANDPSMGGTGICVFGSGGGNTITNNVVIGYKRAVRIESSDNTITNNLLQSAPKTPLYVNGSRPQADLLIHTGKGQKVGGNRCLNNLVVLQNGATMQTVLNGENITNWA
jgi:hypothetical protein